MMGRTHALAGVTLAMAAQPLLGRAGIDQSATSTIALAVGAAGGSMLPDFDHRHATIAQSLGPITKVLAVGIGAISGGHRNGTHSLLGVAAFTAASWWLVSLGGWATGLWAGFLLAVGSSALHLEFTKRSVIMHTLTCLVGAVLLVRSSLSSAMPFELLTWGVFIGAFSHAIVPTDALTKEGCPWLWPVSKKRFKLANLTTDHFMENNVVWWALCLALTCVVLWRAGMWPQVIDALGWLRDNAESIAPQQRQR